jgi:tRNA(adenine34) deaminase
MSSCIELAKHAYDLNEIPIGALVYDPLNKEVVGTGYNRVEQTNDCTYHAEILALKSAAFRRKNWRLNNLVMFVTIEPCLMCLGAIKASRIQHIVFGAKQPRTGALGSHYSLQLFYPELNVVSGVRETECEELIKSFFSDKR